MTLTHALAALTTALAVLASPSLRGEEIAGLYFAQHDDSSLQPISYEKLETASTAITGCRPCAANGGGFLMGVEATFLAPIGGEGQSWGFDDDVNGTLDTFSTDDSGIRGLVPAPRIWFGYAGASGWGWQARYWELNTSATTHNPFIPFTTPPTLTGDTLGFNSGSRLEMQAFDLEVTREFCLGNWNLLGSLGYRHAMRDYQEDVGAQGLIERPAGLGGDVALFLGTASALSNFEGDGLTFALSGSRPTAYGCELFWNSRGSVLWGGSHAGAFANAQLDTPPGGAVEATGAYAEGGDTLWIGEFQVGAQWSTQLACSPARFFARGAFEYQYWGELSSVAGATATVGENNVGSLTMAAGSPSDSLHLVGFAFATGIVW